MKQSMQKELQELQDSVGCESSSIWLREDDLIYPFVFLGPNSLALEQVEIPYDKGLCGYCISRKEKLISNDLAGDERWYKLADEITKYKTNNIICLPIIIHNDCVGCVQLLNKPGGFNDEDIARGWDMVSYLINHL